MSKRALRKQRKVPLGTFFPKGTLRSANGAAERTVDFDIIKKRGCLIKHLLNGAALFSWFTSRQPLSSFKSSAIAPRQLLTVDMVTATTKSANRMMEPKNAAKNPIAILLLAFFSFAESSRGTCNAGSSPACPLLT